MIIDTHAHVYLEDFDEDANLIIERAVTENVEQILLPNIDMSSVDRLLGLCDKNPQIYKPMIGLHPCYVKEDYNDQLAQLKKYLDREDIVAVGEIGIDLYWDKTFEKEQIQAYKTQIEWSKEKSLPFVIHSRESLDLTISIVEKMQDGHLKGVFHCFNGTLEQAQRIMDVGFYMGIGGVVTFKNAGVDKTVAKLPMEYLVVETDAPYLSPVPYRGSRNEPSYVSKVVDKIAEVKEMDRAEVCKLTTENARKLFSL